MASGNGIIRGVKGIFQKPVVKKAVKRIFPDPMDHFKYQDVLWDFREKKALEEWTLVTDDQFGGKSTAEFVQSPSGRAVFKGNISTELPPATDAKYTGMCSIRAQPKRDWMGDVVSNDISDFDGIQMKIRGDGRSYAFNVQPQSIREDDIHQTFIHTRGGPLWEIVRVINN